MMSNQYLTRISVTAGAVVFAAILGTGVLSLDVYQDFKNIHRSWAAYLKRSDIKSYHLSRIHAHLGYGGFIHHFKNYLLRQEPQYLSSARNSLRLLMQALDDYQQTGLTPAEARALADIRGVIENYRRNIPLAVKAAAARKPPTLTDRQVTVNDQPAFYGVRELDSLLQEYRIQGSHSIQSAVQAGMVTAKIGLLVLPAFTVIALLLIYLLHRLTSEVRDSSSRLNSIIDTAAEGVICIDSSGSIEKANGAAERMFGLPADGLVNHDINTLVEGMKTVIDHNVQAWDQKFLRASIEGARLEYVGRRANGATFPLEIAISEIRVGYERKFTGILRDVTERQQVQRAQEERANLAELLHTVASVSNTVSDPRQALQDVVNKICRFKNWPIGHVYSPGSSASGELKSNDIWYLEDEQRFAGFRQNTEQTSFAPGIGLPGRVLSSKQTHWITDIEADDNFTRTYLFEDFSLKSAFAVPVLVQQEVMAVLEFFSESIEEPDETLLKIFSDIGIQLGNVIARKRDNDQITYHATHDSLTGLPNHGVCKDRLSQLIKSAKRHNRQAAVIFTDLDDFKQINDIHGHEAGDYVLQVVAERLGRNTRESDTIARFGGDEFVILLDNPKSILGPETVCQKILKAICEPIIYQGAELRIGICMGIACYPDHGSDPTTLLGNADKAMYNAKKLGKNRYTVASNTDGLNTAPSPQSAAKTPVLRPPRNATH